jgi:hypothetical protein
VFANNPEIVKLDPEPVIVPGFIVQLPEGKPFNITLPVANAHVGWLIVPIAGANGAEGCAFTVTEVAVEIQLLSPVLLTRILCDPADIPANVVETW